MKFSLAIFAALLIVSVDTQALGVEHDRFSVYDWKATCIFNGKGFSLRFSSPSKDPTSDDMRVYLKATSGKNFLLPIEGALFVPTPTASESPNLCEDAEYRDGIQEVGAIKVNDKMALVFIRRDRRPSVDDLVLILINPNSGEYYDVVNGIGSIKRDDEPILVINNGNGWMTRIVRDNVNDKIGADQIFPLAEDWMVINIHGGKIVTNWLRN